MPTQSPEEAARIRLVSRKNFIAMISKGEIGRCIVREGDQIVALGEKKNGALVALRRTYGGPVTWQTSDRPLKTLQGMGCTEVVVRQDFTEISFFD